MNKFWISSIIPTKDADFYHLLKTVTYKETNDVYSPCDGCSYEYKYNIVSKKVGALVNKVEFTNECLEQEHIRLMIEIYYRD